MDAIVTELQPLLMTVPDAARYLGRSVSFIYSELGAGGIKAVKSDARTMVLVESLQKYVASLPAAELSPYRKARRRKIA